MAVTLTRKLAQEYNPDTMPNRKPMSEFAKELSALTDKDRADFALWFAERDGETVSYTKTDKTIVEVEPTK